MAKIFERQLFCAFTLFIPIYVIGINPGRFHAPPVDRD